MKEIKIGFLMTIGAMLAAPNSQSQEIPNLSTEDPKSTVTSVVKTTEKQPESRVLPINSTVENISVEPIFTSHSTEQSNLPASPNKSNELAIKALNEPYLSPKSIAPKVPIEPLKSPSIISVGLQFLILKLLKKRQFSKNLLLKFRMKR
jgi:hypothetical protein